MKKNVALVVIAAIGICLYGCGIIPMSYTRTLPKSIASIAVVDAMTGENIPDAEILCSYEKFVHKMTNFPPSVTQRFVETSGTVLSTTRHPDGTFFIETRDVTVSRKFFTIEDYTVTIRARSKAYIPMSLRYFPRGEPYGEHTWQNGSRTILTEDGHLTIRLERITTSPIHTFLVRDMLTQQPIPHADVHCFYEENPYPQGWFARWSENIVHSAIYGHTLPLVASSDGTFSLETREDFPMNQNVLVSIRVTAEHYRPFSLTTHVHALPLGERKWPRGERTVFTHEGIVTIYLEQGD
jgi:hypothetical protein